MPLLTHWWFNINRGGHFLHPLWMTLWQKKKKKENHLRRILRKYIIQFPWFNKYLLNVFCVSGSLIFSKEA